MKKVPREKKTHTSNRLAVPKYLKNTSNTDLDATRNAKQNKKNKTKKEFPFSKPSNVVVVMRQCEKKKKMRRKRERINASQ